MIVPGLCKVNMKSLKALATEEDIEELYPIYVEYFARAETDDGPIISTQMPLSFDLKDITSGNLGIEVEHDLEPSVLATNLSFPQSCLPHQFNDKRHNAGIIPW